MNDTIMICTDLGKINGILLQKGRDLAVKLNAPIHLVHVLSGEKATPHATPNAFASTAKERIQIQNKMERAEETLKDSGCKVSSSLPSGEIIEALKEEIKKVDPYIIVMGAVNNTALHHVVSGSVAGTILSSTHKQVLLVPVGK